MRTNSWSAPRAAPWPSSRSPNAPRARHQSSPAAHTAGLRASYARDAGVVNFVVLDIAAPAVIKQRVFVGCNNPGGLGKAGEDIPFNRLPQPLHVGILGQGLVAEVPSCCANSTRPVQATRASSAGATVNSASPFSARCPASIGSWARTPPLLLAEGAQGMHRAAPVLEGQASPLRLAIDGHSLRAVSIISISKGTHRGAKWALSAAARAWPSRLLNRRCKVDWQGVRSRSVDWRAPHSAMARTERWLDRMAAPARARIPGRAGGTLRARRRSGMG